MKNRIKDVLRNANMSQKQLAEKIGMTEVGISKAINGSASKETLRKIANALSVSYEELISADGLKAIHEGVLKFGEKEIHCAVLNDGSRVVLSSEVFKAFDRPRKGKSQDVPDQTPAFLTASNLQEFVSEDIEQRTIPVQFISKQGRLLSGYDALIIADVCQILMSAKQAGTLLPSQNKMAESAEIILLSLAKTGIIALVDEATGYDKDKSRARDELQRFLAEFMNKEAASWVKMFPDEFFEDICRMRGWVWSANGKRTGALAYVINDLVYDRIGPCVHAQLNELNPISSPGQRRKRHHQFLTEEKGKPMLKSHLEKLHLIAVLSNYRWDKFMLNVDKAMPKQYQQLSLFDADDFE